MLCGLRWEALAHERRMMENLRAQNQELQGQLVKFAAEMQALLSKETDGKLSRWFRRLTISFSQQVVQAASWSLS